jgi:predicted ferric reductase
MTKTAAKNQGLSHSAEAFTDDIQSLQQINSSRNTLSSWKCAIVRNCWYPLPVSRSTYLIGGIGLIEISFIILLFALCLCIALLTDAKSAGGLSSFLGGFGVLCAIRTGSVLFSFERSLLWHKVFTSLMVITGIIHGVREDAIATGVLLITLLACTSAVYLLATVNFNLFYHFHFWLFFIIAGVAMAHGAAFLFASFLCWLVDLFLRYCMYQKEPETKATILPNTDILHITFSKQDFCNYDCGQYCFLRFRTVSLEHHPFTIASSPLEDKVTFYIRNAGDWSQKVFQAIRRRSEGEALSVITEGPYGQLLVDVMDPVVHEVV